MSVAPFELGLALIVCLAISAVGFRQVVYFISIGYGFSIAGQAVVFALLHWAALDLWSGLQMLLLFAYGMRLAVFLLQRERQQSFAAEQQASVERNARATIGTKILIWVAVSVLYVAMFSPALLTLSAAPTVAGSALLPVGVVLMAVGLGLEAIADRQKSVFKAANPRAFCDVGLYRLVRSPNYLGEMLFWFGTWVSGVPAYRQPLDWVLSIAGLVCIELIMLGSARRLELKQAERYAGDARYAEYARRVPILFPLVPLYSLKRLRVYLG